MSLRSRRFSSFPILPLIAMATIGCPGPEPSVGDDGTGGGAQSSASSGLVGPGPASASSVSTGSEGPGEVSVGVGGAGGVSDGGAGGVGGVGGVGGAGGVGGDGGCGGADLATDVLHCGECFRRCDETEVVEDDMGGLRLMCEDGLCVSKCKPGRGNFNFPEAPEEDDGCETLVLRAFVTSEPVPFPFSGDAADGAEGADELCQAFAAEGLGNLGDKWRAWVSDEDSSPSTRFGYEDLPDRTRWVLLDEAQTPVADGWQQLASAQHQAAINFTEQEERLDDGGRVWTGTTIDGEERVGAHCSNWSLFGGEGIVAGVGEASAMDENWTAVEPPVPCGVEGEPNVHHLYCFEHP